MEKQNKFGVKVGDVFHSSHGYSMCLNSFYQVVEVLGTTKVRVKRLLKRVTSDDGYGQQGHEKMVYGMFDTREDSLDKMVQKASYSDKPFIKINNYEIAFLMNEDEYDESFWFDYMD